MRRRSRLDPEDLMPTDEELEAMRTAQSAQDTGAGVGGAVGTALGGAIGALPGLIPGVGAPLLAVTVPAGMGIGGALGGAVGTGIGGMVAEGAEDKLLDLQGARDQLVADFDLREEALRRFLETT
jgi:hypothetical protein